MSTYITFVVAARNDNYGGNFLQRMQLFVNGLVTLWQKYDLEAELLVVEWNPPQDRPRLKDTQIWPKHLQPHQIRIIEVPFEIHNTYPNSDRMPIFEYIAKNTGIRRAKGEYVLATNPDLLYSEALIEFFAQRKLSPDCFYRVNRYDVAALVPKQLPVEQQLQFCAKHTYQVLTRDGFVPLKKNFTDYYRSFKQTVKSLLMSKPAPISSNNSLWANHERLHTVASGDFFLMNKSQWHYLRGYPEFNTYMYIDGYICFMAASMALKQQILESPLRIYHQDHDRSENNNRPLTNHDEFVIRGMKMLEAGQPEIFNDEDWGLGDKKLSENWINV